MRCKTCGEQLVGDGYAAVMHCPNTEADYLEPDADIVYCKEQQDDSNH